jgi:hypothetical protein
VTDPRRERQLQAPEAQCVPAAQAGADPQRQVPVDEQPSAVLRSQATQVPPPRPQLATDRPTQVPLAQQPLGQEIALQTQTPPTQAVPLPQAAPVPHTQVPVKGSQPLLVTGLQATQLRPPTPQVATAGVWQTPPAQQPPGHDSALQAQTPAWQVVPAAHAALAPQRHAPAAPQLSDRTASQVTQAAPPVPQAVTVGVAQVTPEQQPTGQFAGVQLLHTPPLQIRPAQSWQSAPALPQLVLLFPARHRVPAQQPCGHEV